MKSLVGEYLIETDELLLGPELSRRFVTVVSKDNEKLQVLETEDLRSARELHEQMISKYKQIMSEKKCTESVWEVHAVQRMQSPTSSKLIMLAPGWNRTIVIIHPEGLDIIGFRNKKLECNPEDAYTDKFFYKNRLVLIRRKLDEYNLAAGWQNALMDYGPMDGKRVRRILEL